VKVIAKTLNERRNRPDELVLHLDAKDIESIVGPYSDSTPEKIVQALRDIISHDRRASARIVNEYETMKRYRDHLERLGAWLEASVDLVAREG
jgi:hypothetical protein